MIKIRIADIESDIKRLGERDSYAVCAYASLLRMILVPSTYDMDDLAIRSVVDALRKDESNNAVLLVLRRLNEIAPIELFINHDITKA